jgi:hypothetical protein
MLTLVHIQVLTGVESSRDSAVEEIAATSTRAEALQEEAARLQSLVEALAKERADLAAQLGESHRYFCTSW